MRTHAESARSSGKSFERRIQGNSSVDWLARGYSGGHARRLFADVSEPRAPRRGLRHAPATTLQPCGECLSSRDAGRFPARSCFGHSSCDEPSSRLRRDHAVRQEKAVSCQGDVKGRPDGECEERCRCACLGDTGLVAYLSTALAVTREALSSVH